VRTLLTWATLLLTVAAVVAAGAAAVVYICRMAVHGG